MKSILLMMMLVFSACQMGYAREVSTEEIVSWTSNHQYDKALLVAALAKHESKYNSMKYNPEKSGSYGLMQIQCDTAKSPAFEGQALKGRCDQLYQPEVNIKYGILWLKYVESSLQIPNLRNIISGYNAGFDVNNKKCERVENNRCAKWLYSTRRCKAYTVFNYPGLKPVECYPGQQINEEYVKEVYAVYASLVAEQKSKEQLVKAD
jgi:hypothetical protein